jgi:anti-sigma regulatory factor (Ser/Thr protein kinase)
MGGSLVRPGGDVISLPINGTRQAPRIARNAVRSRLEGWVTDETAYDVALVVSELVTNSVVHADLGADDTVLVEIAVGDDRLAITVTDPGSDFEPQLLPRDPTKAHGLGLYLVDDISASWGVRRNPYGTQVWCELALDKSGPERSESLACEVHVCSGARTSAPDRARTRPLTRSSRPQRPLNAATTNR